MQDKLGRFIDRLKSGDCFFTCEEFDKLDLSDLTENSFLYADPPYLITCASYNEQGGWTEDDERKLLALLDELNERGIHFALSNVLEAKGKTNDILKEWIQSRPNYKLIDLNYTYNNSSYHRQNKEKSTREILVINY
jgi:site-specific DNA-adenine methylase